MDLFSTDCLINLLPFDGIVNYYGKVFSASEATHYFNRLMEAIEWRNDEAIILGKHIVTKRKVAWYADNAFTYTYSNITKEALPWTPELVELKGIAEKRTGETYNSCLMNLYHDGSEGVSWHSDGERALKYNGAIASLSFGAERNFCFKHKKSGQRICQLLRARQPACNERNHPNQLATPVTANSKDYEAQN